MGITRKTVSRWESLDILKRLSAANPTSADLQRDVVASMSRLVDFPGSGITWAKIVAALEDMQRRGVLAPADLGMLEDARSKAKASAKPPR